MTVSGKMMRYLYVMIHARKKSGCKATVQSYYRTLHIRTIVQFVIIDFMKGVFTEHQGFWNARNKRSLYFGILLLVLALVIQSGAGRYSARSALKSNFVGDIFLDNLPTLDLDFIIVEGAILLWIFTGVLLVSRPQYLIFGLKAVALFIITRSFFINLTHIGIYPQQAIFDSTDIGYALYKLFTFQGNFFFSGHTGLPFLVALVFWPERVWRHFFLLVSFIFGVSVLLAHVHYSIDVFAAPFLAYGIFRIAQKFFPKDYALVSS